MHFGDISIYNVLREIRKSIGEISNSILLHKLNSPIQIFHVLRMIIKAILFGDVTLTNMQKLQIFKYPFDSFYHEKSMVKYLKKMKSRHFKRSINRNKKKKPHKSDLK